MTAPPNDTTSGQTAPPPGIELPSPGHPMAAARRLVAHRALNGHAPLRWWRGDFYRHTGTHWAPIETSEVNRWLYTATENAYYMAQNRQKEWEPRTWAPNRKKVGDLQHALAEGVLQHTGEAETCIALNNGVFDRHTRKLSPHDPERFNLHALPFNYDENAECPQWLAFLESVLPGDTEAHRFLQEWFGYVISGRTDLQKMASLVGPRRCGKGTIARILEAMLGSEAVASPSMSRLGGTFGMQNLIGKSLAVMGDVRWNSSNIADAVPVLLGITGEDSQDVDRKNRTAWHGRLGVRFMLMSNDEPNFRDASMALAGRMLHVQFHESFLGREDVQLEGKLLKELSGIFNWALAGLESLDARGYLVQPPSATELARTVERAASPYAAFLEDCCDLEATFEESVPDLLTAYHRWARAEGRTQDQQTAASLSRGLRGANPAIVAGPRRILPNGMKGTMLRGVRIRTTPMVATNEWIVGIPETPDRHQLQREFAL